MGWAIWSVKRDPCAAAFPKRVANKLRQLVPPGRGELDAHDLVGDLGADWSVEAVESAVAALAAAGAVRILGETAGEERAGSGPGDGRSDAPACGDASGSPGRILVLGVHSAGGNLERARTLRRAALAKLATVEAYARARGCRRSVLLGYFGEEGAPARCGGCDRCLGREDPVAAALAAARGRPAWTRRLAGLLQLRRPG